MSFFLYCIIIACATAVGIELRKRLIMRERLLSDILSVIDRIECSIRLEQLPLDRIIEQISEQSEHPEFIDVCRQRLLDGDHFHSAWQAAIEFSGDMLLLKPDERSQLSSLGQRLGYSDVDGELSISAVMRSYFADRRECFSRELANKSKLYMSCSILAGIFISVLLL